ncbi:hypothetical protein [Amycolatopsis benzoatilytica]|uniref:hypothetical protein n=1 Tax=Amycolatopsis benzoatilytica TaxID=346045 RepID=UPI000365D300|nr:hypothetical protein [Amycolatopsis benzoatilytica]
MNPTITETEARDQVEAYVRDAFAALPSSAARQLFSRNRSECTDPTDNGPAGRFEISATYEVTGLKPDTFAAQFDAVLKWWQGHGFTVLTDRRPADQYVFARNERDGFDMSLQANELGKLYLGATSPCVWPGGTPEAAEEPAAEEPEAVAEAVPQEPVPPRARRAPVDDEDFGQTSWADGGAAF